MERERVRHLTYEAQRRNLLKRLGRCVTCKGKTADGKVYCQTCRDKRNARERERAAERTTAGQCVDCTRPVPDGPDVRCERCRRRRARWQKAISARRKRRRAAERRARKTEPNERTVSDAAGKGTAAGSAAGTEAGQPVNADPTQSLRAVPS